MNTCIYFLKTILFSIAIRILYTMTGHLIIFSKKTIQCINGTFNRFRVPNAFDLLGCKLFKYTCMKSTFQPEVLIQTCTPRANPGNDFYAIIFVGTMVYLRDKDVR